MSEKEQRIREIAHRLWEEEGQPADQAERHWQMAVKIVEEEEAAHAHPSSAHGAHTHVAEETDGATGG